MDYFNLDARGTIIKIPKNIAFKSSVLKKSETSHYLNYSPDIVHQAMNYLSNMKVKMNEELEILFKELNIDIPKIMDLPEYFKVNARGTIIQIPIELLEKFQVIKNFMSNGWGDNCQPYYLNYNPQTVYNLISYLEGFTIDSSNGEFLALCDEMLIDLNTKYLDEEFCTELQKKFEEYIDKLEEKDFTEFKKRFRIWSNLNNKDLVKKEISGKIERLFHVKKIESARKYYMDYYNKVINKEKN